MEDGGTMFFRNVGKFLIHHTASYPRRYSAVRTSNLAPSSSTQNGVSYCQLSYIIREGTASCHVAACYRYSARNNVTVLPHAAACNLITPLLCLSSRNDKPCASPGLKLRSEPLWLYSVSALSRCNSAPVFAL
jgi:hypothetical protein